MMYITFSFLSISQLHLDKCGCVLQLTSLLYPHTNSHRWLPLPEFCSAAGFLLLKGNFFIFFKCFLCFLIVRKFDYGIPGLLASFLKCCYVLTLKDKLLSEYYFFDLSLYKHC